jgi:hypothetical protein
MAIDPEIRIYDNAEIVAPPGFEFVYKYEKQIIILLLKLKLKQREGLLP